MTSPILGEASSWSEVPGLIADYYKKVGETGTTNFFVYGSLIKDYQMIKPPSSCNLPEEGGVMNQRARLNGEVMAFDVIASGPYAFRAASGYFTDHDGEKKYFANVGAYCGLEPSADGYVDGLNVAVNASDRSKAWSEYIARELTKPPEGITFNSLLDGTAVEKLAAIKGAPADKFGMYKLQMVTVDTAEGPVPAITVATNEKSPFEFIQRTPMQIAHLILDGQGYRRPNNSGGFVGGAALDYFKQVLNSRRELGFHDPKMEEIAKAVEEYAVVDGEWYDLGKKKLAYAEWAVEAKSILKRHPNYQGVVSPLLLDAREKRDPVSPEVVALPMNQMAHTANEKSERIQRLRRNGEIKFTA